MSNTPIFLVLLLVAIFGGWALKINSGIFAVVFSFLFGVYAVGLSASEIIALWPTRLFITIILVTYYFGFAIQNGTMEGIIKRTMWVSRKVPPLLPIMLYILTFTLGAVGVGAYSIFTFVAPLVMAIAVASGMHTLIALLIIVGGTGTGSYAFTGQFGVTLLNTMATHGWDTATSYEIVGKMWANIALSQVLVFVIVYFLFKGYKIKFPKMDKCEAFNKQQQTTLIIMIISFIMMVVPPVLKNFLPGNAFAIGLNKISDIMVISIVSILLCLIFRVGNDKSALSMIPMSALLLICGISLLISVGMRDGIVEALSVWAENNISGSIAPYFLAIAGGVMSYFASTVGVVIPSLGTICGGVSAGTGIPVALCYSYLNNGAGWSAYSPFSSGGALALAGISNEEHRNQLYKTALIFPFCALIFNLLQIFLGIVIR